MHFNIRAVAANTERGRVETASRDSDVIESKDLVEERAVRLELKHHVCGPGGQRILRNVLKVHSPIQPVASLADLPC